MPRLSTSIASGSSGPRARLRAAAALLIGALVTGCGGSSTGTTAGGTSTSASAAGAVESGVAFSRCIRAHGVPSFPDPKLSGHTVRMGSPSIVRSPAFQSAVHACQRLLPKGPPGPQGSSPQMQSHLLDVSACMRRHGISGFPDPSTSPPSTPAGYSASVAVAGLYLAIPKSIDTSSPAFEQAAVACQFGPGR